MDAAKNPTTGAAARDAAWEAVQAAVMAMGGAAEIVQGKSPEEVAAASILRVMAVLEPGGGRDLEHAAALAASLVEAAVQTSGR